MEENIPFDVSQILGQASDWTFDGDFRILQWMNKISQNLEGRATRTTDSLDRLNNNVKCAQVALDNVANSLTALQYGNQFVECRVQDDDETSMTAGGNEATVANGVNTPTKPSSKEMLVTFLDNNLKVLRNCHEKYSIDLDDSDEEDEKCERTYIFQPINPYNEKPLPHIFGSKDWCEKWHVGLGDDEQDNNYSGDEMSETYSQSSSCSPTPDNDSYETNSEFASSVSVSNDNLERNTSTLRRSKFETMSETSSSHSSAAKQSTHKRHSNDILQDIHAVSSTVISHSNSDKFQKISNESNASSRANNATPVRSNVPPYIDLFSEPPEDPGSASASSIVDQNFQKTENLFNDDVDDVFKHLVIAQSKRNEPPVPRERTNIKVSPLCDDQGTIKPNDKNTTEKSKNPKTGVSVLPTYNINDQKHTAANTPSATLRTPKNLFEDDESEDDDFLSAFTKTQKPLNNSMVSETAVGFKDTFSNSKNSIIDDTPKQSVAGEIERPEEQIQQRQMKYAILFDDDYDEEILETLKRLPESKPSPAKLFSSSPDIRTKTNTASQSLAHVLKSSNLFEDDDDDDDSFFKSLPSKKASQNVTKTEADLVTPLGVGVNNKKPPISLPISIHADEKVETSNHAVPEESVVKPLDTTDETHELFSEADSSTVVKTGVGVLSEASKYDDDDDDFMNTLPPIPTSPSKSSKKQFNISSNKVQKISAPQPQHDYDEDDFMANFIPSRNFKTKRAENESKPHKSVDKDLTTGDATTTNQNSNNCDDAGKKELLTLGSNTILKEQKSDDKAAVSVTSNQMNTDKSQNINIDEKVEADNIFTKPQDERYDLADPESNRQEFSHLPQSEKNQTPEEKQNVYPSSTLDSENNLAVKSLTSNFASAAIIPNKDMHIEKNVNAINQQNIETFKDDLYSECNASKPENTAQFNKVEKTKCIADRNDAPSEEKSSQKYDFSSSFLFDEPPDDDDSEFFDSLGKTSQQSIGFDLEQDMYSDPQLTNMPNTEISLASTYAGLQLFDDIPPEDDGFHEIMTRKPETTKRFNNVFYDDFHETLEALNAKQKDSHIPTTTHSILKNDLAAGDAYEEEINQPVSNDDRVDFRKPNTRTKENNEEVTIATKLLDRPNTPALSDENPGKLSNAKLPISKLQLPNININVDALLPFNSRIPSQLKKPEKQEAKQEIDSVATASSHILPNVNKNRVRAPLNRRPSSRKARHESYRISLLEEELGHFEDVAQKEVNSGQKIITQNDAKLSSTSDKMKEFSSSSVNQESSVNADEIIDASTQSLAPSNDPVNEDQRIDKNATVRNDEDLHDKAEHKCHISEKPAEITAILSNDRNTPLNSDVAQNPSIFNETPQNTMKSKISNEPEAGLVPPLLSAMKSSRKSNNVSKPLFSDSESDDDLFSNLSASKPKSIVVLPKQVTNERTLKAPITKPSSSLFGDDSEDDDDADFLKSANTSSAALKNKPKMALQTKSIFSDTEDSDDGDLFGSKSKAVSRVTNTAPHFTAGDSKSVGKQSIADNPLADLL